MWLFPDKDGLALQHPTVLFLYFQKLWGAQWQEALTFSLVCISAVSKFSHCSARARRTAAIIAGGQARMLWGLWDITVLLHVKSSLLCLHSPTGWFLHTSSVVWSLFIGIGDCIPFGTSIFTWHHWKHHTWQQYSASHTLQKPAVILLVKWRSHRSAKLFLHLQLGRIQAMEAVRGKSETVTGDVILLDSAQSFKWWEEEKKCFPPVPYSFYYRVTFAPCSSMLAHHLLHKFSH